MTVLIENMKFFFFFFIENSSQLIPVAFTFWKQEILKHCQQYLFNLIIIFFCSQMEDCKKPLNI